MKIRRLIYNSFQMMGRFKLRTSFMMLGSLIGVAALTFVLSVGQLAQQKILKMVSRMFSDSTIVVHAGGGAMLGGHMVELRASIPVTFRRLPKKSTA